MLSVYFWSAINPVRLCILLIFIALLLGSIFWACGSKWIGIRLILVFVGGIIVAFLYVSSLAFNQKIALNYPKHPLLFFLVLLLWNKTSLSFLSFSPAFSFTTRFSPLLVSLIIYLLIALFLVVKISESFKGALTQKF